MKKSIKRQNEFLEIMGWISIGFTVLIPIVLTGDDWIGAIPFLINSIFTFRYLNNKMENKSGMIAYSIFLIFTNLLADGGPSFFDAIMWSFTALAWYKAE